MTGEDLRHLDGGLVSHQEAVVELGDGRGHLGVVATKEQFGLGGDTQSGVDLAVEGADISRGAADGESVHAVKDHVPAIGAFGDDEHAEQMRLEVGGEFGDTDLIDALDALDGWVDDELVNRQLLDG